METKGYWEIFWVDNGDGEEYHVRYNTHQDFTRSLELFRADQDCVYLMWKRIEFCTEKEPK